MADPAGKLQIRIAPDGVEIRSSRPVRAAALFHGQGIEETARLLPVLFGICATAQSAACAAALEAAQGLAPDPATRNLRRTLVETETLREHLWRVLLDWPALLGEEPQHDVMARVMGLAGLVRSALGGMPFRPGAGLPHPARPAAEHALTALSEPIAERVLGLPPADWLARVGDLGTLTHWSAATETTAARLIRRLLDAGLGDLGRSPIALLPPLDAPDLDRWLGGPEADRCVARPTGDDGLPRDASALARQAASPLLADLLGRLGNGLIARLAAQLQELARLATRERTPDRHLPRASAAGEGRQLGVGLGIGQVQAARGLLVHRVRIADGRIWDYRILAPTEWSFHPHGAVAAGLADLAARAPCGERARLARLFVAAVDPCVQFDLELTDRVAHSRRIPT